MVERSGLDWQCLYEDTLADELLDVAPYLVSMRSDARVTQDLIAVGWSSTSGIWIISPAPIAELRRHLRRFLRVRDDRGRQLLFRFYDPLVLAAFLPTCMASELAALFGPIDAFLLEAASPAAPLTELSFDGVELNARGRTLSESLSASGRPRGPGRSASASEAKLVIRKAQLQALEDGAAMAALRRTADRLAARHPRSFAGLDDAARLAFVRTATQRAASHGVRGPADLDRYLDHAVRLGLEFDVDPGCAWAGAILRAPFLDGARRMDRLDVEAAARARWGLR